MEFVSSFEEQCCSLSSVKALRNHPSYNAFMSKWSLPVYFQIRSVKVGMSSDVKLFRSGRSIVTTLIHGFMEIFNQNRL